jgi:hypothetical protein
VCNAGRCVCATGTTVCGAQCVNLQTSAANCGRCGNAYGGRVCVAGACACPTGTMVGGGSGGACVNLQTSATNCGMCGSACAMGTTCMAGVCR